MCDQQSLRSACAYTQSDQSFCLSLELLTEHHLEFLSLKGGCTGSSESTLVKMPHFWKSHVTAQIVVDSLFIVAPIVFLFLVLLCGVWCPFWFCNHHWGRERLLLIYAISTNIFL